tara:strand:+ start:463 stop:798 length:336 start_codon:yes stop_codon:yes gene_type:complete
MKIFDNFEKAHKHFKFPGSHRIGALFKNSYIVRIYSNSVSKPDYFNKSKTLFYYTIKSKLIKQKFLNNKKDKISVKVFTKDINLNKVIYHGEYQVVGIRQSDKYVLLQKNH